MKKVVRLSESDIARIVNKIINEQPERDRTGDLYADINSLIDDEYNDVDYEDVANVLENILRGIKAQSHRNKKGMKPISKNDILKNFGLNEQEEESRPFLKRLIAKLKNITDKQITYNLKNDLPWDWNGSKEGYYEKMEPRKRHTGSN
jgi:hypothetical protein